MSLPLVKATRYQYLNTVYEKSKELEYKKKAEQGLLRSSGRSTIFSDFSLETIEQIMSGQMTFPQNEATTVEVDRFPDGVMTCFICQAQTSDECYKTGKEQLCWGEDPGIR